MRFIRVGVLLVVSLLCLTFDTWCAGVCSFFDLGIGLGYNSSGA